MWRRSSGAVQVYCRDENRGMRELGRLDFDAPEAKLAALFDEIESLPAEDLGCVGLSRSDADYVEVSPIGNGQYFLWSDRLCRAPGLFACLRRENQLERALADRAEAMAALQVYCELSREAFEQRFG